MKMMTRLAGASLMMVTGAVFAQTPTTIPNTKPYALRGVELGITLDEFRQIPRVLDQASLHSGTFCTGDPRPTGVSGIEPVLQPEAEIGVTNCQWWSRETSGFTSTVFVDIGDGKGPPVFEFIEQLGVRRLFRISLFANSQYYARILSALTRGYGAPRTEMRAVQTRTGATFEAATSTWSNGASTIVLTEMCRQVDRYCLVYRHKALGAHYDALMEQRAAAVGRKL